MKALEQQPFTQLLKKYLANMHTTFYEEKNITKM